MCLSCSRNENRRLYLFMQLSVMMIFNGQSTWEMLREKKEEKNVTAVRKNGTWSFECEGKRS